MKNGLLVVILLVCLASSVLAATTTSAGYKNLGFAVTCRTGGTGGLLFNLNGNSKLGVEAGYVGAGNNSSLGLAGRYEMALLRPDKNTTCYGAGTLSLVNAAGTSTLAAAGLVGVEYRLTTYIAVFADLSLLMLSQTGNTTTISLINGSNFVYTGARVYL